MVGLGNVLCKALDNPPNARNPSWTLIIGIVWAGFGMLVVFQAVGQHLYGKGRCYVHAAAISILPYRESEKRQRRLLQVLTADHLC